MAHMLAAPKSLALPLRLLSAPAHCHDGAALRKCRAVETGQRHDHPSKTCRPSLFAVAAASVLPASLAASQRSWRSVKRTWRRMRSVKCRAVEVTEDAAVSVQAPPDDAFVTNLLKNVMEVRLPRKLTPFLETVLASGYELLNDEKVKQIGGDLHPFILPVGTKGSFDADKDEIEVIGLLVRTPLGGPLKPDEYQVVTQLPRQSRQVRLIAKDLWQYVMLCAEIANFRREKQDLPMIEETRGDYQVRFKGSDRLALDKWLLLEVGDFPEVYLHHMEHYLEEGDLTSAVSVMDKMKQVFGTDWGFPHAYQAKLYNRLARGRELEAQHSALRAIKTGLPLWTLQFADDRPDVSEIMSLVHLGQLQFSSVESLKFYFLRRSVDDQRAAVRTKSISLGCVALAQAQALLDASICGHMSFNALRPQLADLYDELPGTEPLVALIHHLRQP